MLVIGLFFGAGLGFLFAAANEVTLSGHDHGAHAGHGDHAMGSHMHAPLDVSGEGPLPELALALSPDGPGAWNLHMMTQNFRFTPEAVNGPHQPGTGHAHIYVNGTKLARTYGPWFQLTGLRGGDMVRVTLNANSHDELANGDTPIAAMITVPEEG